MGRASNRKKAQRQGGPRSRQASQSFPANAADQRALLQVVGALQAIVQENQQHERGETAARRTWSGGADPVPAEAPRWAEGSLGDRFFGATFLDQPRKAPNLATAQIPDAVVIAADTAHWNVATDALIRAVLYDGLGLDHPAVRTVLEVLAPIAEAELAYGDKADAAMYGGGPPLDEDEPEFPEDDGPVMQLGAFALTDATWAAVGLDSLGDVLGVLRPVLAEALPGVDREIAGDALIGGFTKHFRCELPGDAEILQRVEDSSGNALVNLVRAGAVPPREALPAGLAILSALAKLCRSDSASLLQRAA